jgi:hypothetical protein
MYPLVTARQQLGKNITTATNTHVITEEVQDVLFSIWSVLYQRFSLVLFHIHKSLYMVTKESRQSVLLRTSCYLCRRVYGSVSVILSFHIFQL